VKTSRSGLLVGRSERERTQGFHLEKDEKEDARGEDVG